MCIRDRFGAHRTVQVLATTFGSIYGVLALFHQLLTRAPGGGRWLADPQIAPGKRLTEVWFLKYGVFWILCFGVIVGGGLYVWFDRMHYMLVCGGLALPLYLQPVVAPWITGEAHLPLLERYCFKANLWLAIFGFVGNYWYTHYFYSVLQASYTMPSWDLNGVPIPMFFATHFYFTFYHAASNLVLRKVYTTYVDTCPRALYAVAIVLSFSYTTAFMESLTIAAFPCYNFADTHMAYTLGSAFYGIYFIVSFPMFLRMDEPKPSGTGDIFSWKQAMIEACATSMIVLCLLDFVRIGVTGIDLTMAQSRPCKLDASQTCAPFTGGYC
eukprot:TRINITY_DN27338_c0_g1_i2.p1 TRINITY_DN27338_c0_g1~~TRINITY_DN27338_c0_g1_i2.p1  ORF type:complete len:326 (+),score=53.70 TRINITY_DN27338_c0_g1_i2:141-1118(+)